MAGMDLRFVQAFHWAVVLGGVTRAAEKLHLTQSAVSARIGSLEAELGIVLLDRRDRQFRLTVAGQRFHVLAQRLLAMEREICEEMGGESRTGAPLTLRLGAMESVLHSWLTPWLQRLREDRPGLQLELTVETTAVLLDQLQRGALDLVLASVASPVSGMHTRHLQEMDMVFVGHAQRHTAPGYTLAELVDLQLMTFQRGSQPHQALWAALREAGLAEVRVHAVSSVSAMVQLVEAGFGVATLPLATLQCLGERHPLRALPCPTRLQPLPVHASYLPDPTSRLTESVLESVVAYLGGDTPA